MEATVAIRTDYSPQIGSGHYMRCRTLAKALQKRGCQVTFMFRYLPEFCQEELRREGFESFSLSTPFLPSASQVLKMLKPAEWPVLTDNLLTG